MKFGMGFFGAFGVLTVAILAESHWRISSLFALVSLPSLLIVFGMTFFLLLASHGNRFWSFLKAAFGAFLSDPSQPDQSLSEVARDGEQFALFTGTIGAVVGVIQMLANLEDPASIGSNFAVSLLSIFQGLVLAECFFAPLARLLQADTKDVSSATRAGFPVLFGGFFLLLTCFFIMLFAFNSASSPSNRERAPETTSIELPIETNLANLEDGHSIKFKVCFQFNDSRTRGLAGELTPVIRERIIQALLKKTLKDVGSPTAFETLKAEVSGMINASLKEAQCPEVTRVIFSEFLVK